MFLLFLLLSCGKPVPSLEGFDAQQWKNDPSGCRGERVKLESALTSGIERIKGLSESDINAFLGKPDRNELYERNQKFYHYYITAGPACETKSASPRKLTIRFNAMGYAQVITIVED